jgi:hypothetical protein
MPVEPTLPQTISLSSVSELRDQASRLGLTWNLRAATVAETNSAFTAYVPRIDLDGDENVSSGITAVSFIGGVAVGMRVMVMIVPPVGYYIVGAFNPAQTQRFEIGARTSHGTTITTTEAVLETFDAFTVLPGAAYRVEVDGWLLAGTTTFTIFRIRKTSTAGQSLTASDAFPGGGLTQGPMRHVGYFVNTTTDAVTADLVLTGITLASTSTWSADSERPRYVSIQYAGPAVEYPSAVGIT